MNHGQELRAHLVQGQDHGPCPTPTLPVADSTHSAPYTVQLQQEEASLVSSTQGLGQPLPTGSLKTGLFIRCQAPQQVPLKAVMTHEAGPCHV